MEKVCPLCNGLLSVSRKCPYCGNVLQDGGMIKDYFGPYSPYVAQSTFTHKDEHKCVHLLYCAACHYDVQDGYQLVIM